MICIGNSILSWQGFCLYSHGDYFLWPCLKFFTGRAWKVAYEKIYWYFLCFRVWTAFTVLKMALIKAAKKNKIEQVQFLLSAGTDVNQTDRNGSTALTWAAMLGHSECVSLLIKHPLINPNLRNRWGDNALFWAGMKCNKEIFSLLIDHPEIDVNFLYDDGETILSLLVANYCKEEPHSEEMLFTLMRKGRVYSRHFRKFSKRFKC